MKDQKKVWNSLSKSWNNFRRNPFPKRIFYLSKSWKRGKIVDIGCGNGRNLIPFAKKGFSCDAVDFSIDMIKFAKSRFRKLGLKCKFHVSNMNKLPFKDNNFDYIICVASFHHLNKFDQEKALKEFKRILKPGGEMYITVWNKWQSRFLFGKLKIKLKNIWQSGSFFELFRKKEVFIPWKVEDKIYQRYYYLFNYLEFKNLLSKYFKIKHSEGIFEKNIELIVKK